MNLQKFNQITDVASKFWKKELLKSNKIEKEISTICGCYELEPSLLEISTMKIQQYLVFQEEEANLCKNS